MDMSELMMSVPGGVANRFKLPYIPPRRWRVNARCFGFCLGTFSYFFPSSFLFFSLSFFLLFFLFFFFFFLPFLCIHILISFYPISHSSSLFTFHWTEKVHQVRTKFYTLNLNRPCAIQGTDLIDIIMDDGAVCMLYKGSVRVD